MSVRIIKNRPDYLPGGKVKFLVPKALADRNDERVLGLRLMLNRELFGFCYRLLMPDLFDAMGPDSGVLIRPLVVTHHLRPGLTFPGDIDLLIIPYEGQSLLLSHTLAVELKAVRASYLKQGKSPNEFGFSQASALLDAGFPYVAVGYLIVSDQSPPDAWRETGFTTIKDAVTGACEPMQYVKADLMPGDLIDRSIGRLKANCSDSRVGYFAAYIVDGAIWHPRGRASQRHVGANAVILDAIYDYYCSGWEGFFDTRRWPPR